MSEKPFPAGTAVWFTPWIGIPLGMMLMPLLLRLPQALRGSGLAFVPFLLPPAVGILISTNLMLTKPAGERPVVAWIVNLLAIPIMICAFLALADMMGHMH